LGLRENGSWVALLDETNLNAILGETALYVD